MRDSGYVRFLLLLLGCNFAFYPCSYTCHPKGGGGNFTNNNTAVGIGPAQVTALSTDVEKLGFIYDLLSGNAFGNSLLKAFPNITIKFYPIFNSNGALIGKYFKKSCLFFQNRITH
jgi:hypothetical protein